MKTFSTFLFLCLSQWAFSQNMVTFSVDLSEYTGTYSEVNLNGTFNSWCGSCALMTDDNADGIYEITVDLPLGQIEYKFTLDGWTVDEQFTPGNPCTLTTGNFTNRVYNVTGTETLPVVCWESCSDCSSGPSSADVTFRIDMSTYTGAIGVVNLNGTFNGWCGGCAVMLDDNGDNIYEITVNLLVGPAEYKYTVDGWDFDETLNEGDFCTLTTDGFTNRFVDVTEETVLPVVCWESCNACGVTGLSESEITSFSVYPNPTEGIFQFNSDIRLSELQMIKVYSSTGQLAFTQELKSGNTGMINLSHLSAGFYMVELQSERGVVIQSLTIAR